jgi:hypothetical protein
VIQAKPSEPHRTKARERGPNLAEQRTDQLVHWAAFGLERVAERFRILAKLSHGQESHRWARMARSAASVALNLRTGSAHCQELRQMMVAGSVQ